MIKPPSLQRARTDFYSGDPAFVQPPKLAPDADAEAIAEHAKALAEHARRWEVARETGDYSELLIGGAEPTPFVMVPIKGETFRKLADGHNGGRLALLELSALAFRAAIKDLPTLEQIKVTRVVHAIGEIASSEVTDYLDAIDLGIVSELGRLALNRASHPGPKS